MCLHTYSLKANVLLHVSSDIFFLATWFAYVLIFDNNLHFFPPGMQRCSDISIRFHIGWDVATMLRRHHDVETGT